MQAQLYTLFLQLDFPIYDHTCIGSLRCLLEVVTDDTVNAEVLYIHND